jgi:hypothetical protein
MRAMDVLVTGGTGYIGRQLIPALLGRGHQVRVLARAESAGRVTPGASTVVGNALDASSYAAALKPGDTLVHLVGTPHPSPAKVAEFDRVDRASIEAAVAAASTAGAGHFVYVSVAHPAPIMKAYIRAGSRGAGDRARRADCDDPQTVVRPRAGPPMAGDPDAGLCAAGSDPVDARAGAAAGAGDDRRDDPRPGHGRRRSAATAYAASDRGS